MGFFRVEHSSLWWWRGLPAVGPAREGKGNLLDAGPADQEERWATWSPRGALGETDGEARQTGNCRASVTVRVRCALRVFGPGQAAPAPWMHVG